MEKNIFDALPGFDDLPERYSFDSLPEREKELVLHYITREAYDRFREAVLASKKEGAPGVDKMVLPDPRVKERLMHAFDTGNTAPVTPASPLFRRLLRYRIPAYQAGLAASVLLFFLVYSFIRTHHLSVQLATTDTVFIDRPVTLTDTVWLEKPVEPAPKMPGSSVHRTSREKEPVDERVDNPLYARQMEEALARIAAITALSKDKPGFRDAALMKLVSTGLPATGE